MRSLIVLAALTLACDDARVVTPPVDADATIASDASASDATSTLDAGEPLDAAVADAAPRPDTGPADSGVEPIVTTPGMWQWVDVPESACDEGTPTGFGVNASPSGAQTLLIFLNGGGACWDYTTCITQSTSTRGPFRVTAFNRIAPALGGGLFTRFDPTNPFRDYTQVFVPYCTGDLHAGDRIIEYTGATGPVTFHHVGHTNMLAYLTRLQATFPQATKVVLSGASAGGYGTLFNYDDVRARWPHAQVYLLDDSGPLLSRDAISQTLRDAWAAAWGIGPLLERVCGAACRMDYSLGYQALAARYPDDRFALLSSLQDQTIRAYLGLTPQDFEAALLDAADNAIAPTANFEYFLIPGDSHTMLGTPEAFSSNGTALYTWLTRFVEDDPAWTSTKP